MKSCFLALYFKQRGRPVLHGGPGHSILFRYQQYLCTMAKSWKVTSILSSDCNKFSRCTGSFLNFDKAVLFAVPFTSACSLSVESWAAADRKGVGRVGLEVNEETVVKRLTSQRGKHEAACRWIISGLQPADQRHGFTKESIYTHNCLAKQAQPWNSLPACFFNFLLLEPAQQQNTTLDRKWANKGGQD